MSRVAQRSMAAGLVVAAVVWAFVNGPVEGPVLFELSPDHGVTVADLGSVVAVVAAGFLLVRSRPWRKHSIRQSEPRRLRPEADT